MTFKEGKGSREGGAEVMRTVFSKQAERLKGADSC